MKFLIVTPSFNRPEFLDQTIASVISQSGNFDIHFVVQDGGSNQSVLSILEAWRRKVVSSSFEPSCKSIVFEYFVEPDTGMYDAINKGFSKGNADLMAWINSDDVYLPGAFAAVQEIFSGFKNIDWLVGTSCCINASGAVTSVNPRQLAISRSFLQKGFYRADLPLFTWLPQESIFWRSSLWQSSGPLETKHKLVSDFKLWQAFAKLSDPTKCETLIGAFRYHNNQLTAAPTAYSDELGPASKVPLGVVLVSALGRATPWLFRKFHRVLFNRFFLGFLRLRKEDITGTVIHWDFENEKWISSTKSAV